MRPVRRPAAGARRENPHGRVVRRRSLAPGVRAGRSRRRAARGGALPDRSSPQGWSAPDPGRHVRRSGSGGRATGDRRTCRPNVRDEAGSRPATLDRARRKRRLKNRLATRACHGRPHDPVHDEAARNVLQLFGDVLAEPLQPAAVGALTKKQRRFGECKFIEPSLAGYYHANTPEAAPWSSPASLSAR